MFNVWCVWWICHIVNSQLRKSALESTAKWWFAVLKKQDPYVFCSIKVEPLTLAEGHAVFYIWQSSRALATPRAVQNYPTPTRSSPFCEATMVEQGPNTKCMRVRHPHLFNFPTISLRDCLVWCAIATKLSFKWEKSTPRRWKVRKISQSCHCQVFPGL